VKMRREMEERRESPRGFPPSAVAGPDRNVVQCSFLSLRLIRNIFQAQRVYPYCSRASCLPVTRRSSQSNASSESERSEGPA
jgi:hypothetical protein